MIRSQALWSSLALCLLWAAVQPVAGQGGNFFNMDFNYGFFDGLIPAVDPTEPEFFALVCQTADWLSATLQNGTGNTCANIEASQISYTRNEVEGNATYGMTFVGDIGTWDGSPPPTSAQVTTLLDPLLNPQLNIQDYIYQYVYAATTDNATTSYWRDVDRMDFRGVYDSVPIPGTFPTAGCEPVIPQVCIIPTDPPSNNTDGGAGDDGMGGNGTDPNAMGGNGTDPIITPINNGAGGDDGTGGPGGNGTDPNGAGAGGAGGGPGGNGTDSEPPLNPDDFDETTFYLDVAGVPVDPNVDPVQCPDQWEAATSCMRQSCPNYLDVCPNLPLPTNTVAPRRLQDDNATAADATAGGEGNGTMAETTDAGNGTATGDTMESDVNGTATAEIAAPGNGTDANATEPQAPSCEELGGAICDFGQNDCCVPDCDKEIQDLVACTIDAVYGEDRSTCPDPACPDNSDDPNADPEDNIAPNTGDWVYFKLDYGFEEDGAAAATNGDGSPFVLTEPEQAEIEDLICRTNLFFRDVLRNKTGDDTVQAENMYVDWQYEPGTATPVSVSFGTNATSESGRIPENDVWMMLQVSTEEILRYIREYVLTTQPDNVFQNVNSVNFTSTADEPVPVGRIESVDCPETPAPTNMPTVSAMPSVSPAPSAAPSVSSAPSVSPAPSAVPTISPAPTPTAQNPSNGGGGDGGPTDGSGASGSGGVPTISPVPTVSPAPTISPQPTGTVRTLPINLEFIVSNIEGITSPDEVRSKGLDSTWPAFVQKEVSDISAARDKDEVRRLLRQGRFGHRNLAVGYESDSAKIDTVTSRDCPADVEAHPDAICHDVTSSYVLQVRDEDDGEIETDYKGDTTVAINDGTYQQQLDAEESPLYIGVYPPDGSRGVEEDDKMPLWLLILIILLCILCCLCCLCALIYLWMKNKNDQDKQLDPYDEEGFVYDFLIPPNQKPQTEVDDDAETKDVEEEEFEDEMGADDRAAKNMPDDNPVIVMPEEVMEDDEPEKSDSEEEEPAALMPAEVEEESPEEEPRGGLADIDDSDDEPAAVEEPEESEEEPTPEAEEKFVDEPETEPEPSPEPSEEPAPAEDSEPDELPPQDDSEPEEVPNELEDSGSFGGGEAAAGGDEDWDDNEAGDAGPDAGGDDEDWADENDDEPKDSSKKSDDDDDDWDDEK